MPKHDDNSLTDAEIEQQLDELTGKYEQLAALTAPPGLSRPNTFLFLIHVLLTGPKAPHERLLTDRQKQEYLGDVLRLEERDAGSLMALYSDAVQKYPDDFPHLDHLLEAARRRLSESEEEQWLHTPLVSVKKH